MDPIAFLRQEFTELHRQLEATMEDVTPGQAHWLPPGKALPLGAQYVHIVTGEDAIVNAMLGKGQPLFRTSWAGRTGISEPPPESMDWADWARALRVDLPSLRAYAQAVYASVDAYIASLTAEDLERTVEFGPLGRRTQAEILGSILAGHDYCHLGEISCLKGLQGARGYPD